MNIIHNNYFTLIVSLTILWNIIKYMGRLRGLFQIYRERKRVGIIRRSLYFPEPRWIGLDCREKRFIEIIIWKNQTQVINVSDKNTIFTNETIDLKNIAQFGNISKKVFPSKWRRHEGWSDEGWSLGKFCRVRIKATIDFVGAPSRGPKWSC